MPLNPVVLVHGITDTFALFKTMTNQLDRLGWETYGLDLLPANGDCELDRLAKQLAEFVEANLPLNQPFDLVGFSMGGLVSRYYLQRLGGIDRVQRFVSISAPHNGTIAAYLSQRPGCLQMRPNSGFINDLNRDVQMLDRINFTSIWTPLDGIIVPANSSVLPVGESIQIKVPLHAWMVTDKRSINLVAEALRRPVCDRHSSAIQ
ncbi:MAG: triacylglycerol lipase [Plectolyngbya sp. WJT66-NPBG17]|jgi:triacylglycerol lipase|nr:triacylglycerol lipase [Plectolyngbya sp. WJT66-NPBG17]